jgi:molybdopterin/thiamine biosynthesis adenylyltransferase
MTIDDDRRERFVRQSVIPGIGEAGQARLAAARVLVVGLGGLGSPAATYLLAAGVGTLGLLDADRVGLSNLNRQWLHGAADLGRPKTTSAVAALAALDPAARLVPLPVRLDPTNADHLLAGYDLVLDASDNFATKYLLNDACLRRGLPFVHGGVNRWAGQVLAVRPHVSACCRCAFGDPPMADTVPDNATLGVLGAAAGVVGALQAGEALKLLLGLGQPGVLLRVDLLDLRCDRFEAARDPACPACGGSDR